LPFAKELWGTLNFRPRRGMLWEPPGADPHAEWCGDWRGEIPSTTGLDL